MADAPLSTEHPQSLPLQLRTLSSMFPHHYTGHIYVLLNFAHLFTFCSRLLVLIFSISFRVY